jgi:hypothetical protein
MMSMKPLEKYPHEAREWPRGSGKLYCLNDGKAWPCPTFRRKAKLIPAQAAEAEAARKDANG